LTGGGKGSPTTYGHKTIKQLAIGNQQIRNSAQEGPPRRDWGVVFLAEEGRGSDKIEISSKEGNEMKTKAEARTSKSVADGGRKMIEMGER